MPHESGNPVWQPYPDLTTPIEAARLEAIENAIDRMTPAQWPVCEARLVTPFQCPAVTDVYAQTGWGVQTDPMNMCKLSQVNGTFSYIEIPVGWGGRYLVRYHATSTIGQGGTHAGKVTRNARAATSAVATGLAVRGAAGADGAVWDAINDVILAAGDRLYWGNFTSVAAYVVPQITANADGTGSVLISVPTAIEVRYLGPR